MTLPDPIDKKTIPGAGAAHERWHEDMHITSNLIFSGTGTPEANQAAPVGSIFLRTDGAADTTFYSKETGSGDTGWVAVIPGVVPSNLILSGTGTPEANVTAGVGAIFLRTDGGAETTLYSKESGAGNTGWSAMAGV